MKGSKVGQRVFSDQYANPERKKDEFSIASQHYDFCTPTIWHLNSAQTTKNFHVHRSTTVQILDENSPRSWPEIRCASTIKTKGIMQRIN